MSLMEWTEDLSVGVEVLDEDHKKLIALINRLHDAMKAERSRDVMASILSELVDYTEFHFSREEEFFDRTSYPDTFSHKMQHKKLTDKVKDIRSQYESGAISISMDLMAFLEDWLFGHIKGTDKKYTEHLNANDIR